MEITQKNLHEWLLYDPETGVFTWKKSPSRAVKAGDVAGNINIAKKCERRIICIKGQRFYAARAAYIYVNGDISKRVLVDHVNGDTLDDRICNLRLASSVQNVFNRIQRKGAKYKLGVSKDPRSRYKARIQMECGRKLNLGTWDTEDEAHAAYMGAAAILHGDYWVGNREDAGKAAQRARAKKAQGERK